ncbi:Uncharacterised protein [Myroides odoratus]|uniref:Uncharacterized protein n=1 Tax=Myroides odoratus TaxID=256 RepID=A0A378RLB9_MYROD|nr:Uncharacterised protein [Myroides odoratus]
MLILRNVFMDVFYKTDTYIFCKKILTASVTKQLLNNHKK